MNEKYEKRVTRVTIGLVGEPQYAEGNFDVTIESNPGGCEYIKISESRDDHETVINVDRECWPVLREAVDEMLGDCRENG